jgi:hypothetical protein
MAISQWSDVVVAYFKVPSIIRAVIALMIKAVSTSKISLNFYETTRINIPEG